MGCRGTSSNFHPNWDCHSFLFLAALKFITSPRVEYVHLYVRMELDFLNLYPEQSPLQLIHNGFCQSYRVNAAHPTSSSKPYGSSEKGSTKCNLQPKPRNNILRQYHEL
jgi:hypothetical protein